MPDAATKANPFTLLERDILRPRARLLPADWAERHVVVGSESPAAGPFSKNTMPVLTSVINSIADPRYSRTVAMAGTQSGKSLAVNQIRLAYNLEYRRRNTGFGIPNVQLARRIHATKLRPMFDAVPALKRLLPTGGSGSRGGFPHELVLKNGAQFGFMGAGSAAGMSSATFHDLIVDETDKADGRREEDGEGSTIDQMIRRTDAHPLTRHLTFSCTPTTPDGYISRAYRDGTEGRPFFRCVACGEWFCFVWDWDGNQVAWDDDTDELSCLRSAYYACPACDARLRDSDRLAMLRYPLWVHAGERVEACRIDEAEALLAEDPFAEAVVCEGDARRAAFRVTGTRKNTRAISFWWNRLTSPFVSLGDIALRVREAREDMDRRHGVAIYDMGLPYDSGADDEISLSREAVLAHADYAEYSLGTIPFAWSDSSCLLTVGVDLHKRWGTWIVDAWRFDASRRLVDSWLIDLPRTTTKFGQVGYIYPNPDGTMRIYHFLNEVVLPLCQRGWTDTDGRVVRPGIIGIDCGYQNDTRARKRVEPHDKEVFAFCVSRGQRVWRAVRGMPNLDGGEPYLVKMEGQKGRRVVVNDLDKDIINTEVMEQEKVKPGGAGVRYIPRDTPEYYARCMCAEKRVVRLDSQGRPVSAWERQDAENHLFDCRGYSWGVARIFGILPPMCAALIEEQDS